MSEVFGCCSKYIQCSNKGECIYLHESDYGGCQYRKNLEAGKNFYKTKKYEEEVIMEIKVTITNLEDLVQAMSKLAEAMKGNNSEDKAATPAKVTKQKAEKKEQESPTPNPVKRQDPVINEPLPNQVMIEEPVIEEPVIEEEDLFGSPEPEKTYTFDEVKAKLASLSQAGKQNEMKQLILSFGASKLSDIPVEKYSELMKKAEAIG